MATQGEAGVDTAARSDGEPAKTGVIWSDEVSRRRPAWHLISRRPVLSLFLLALVLRAVVAGYIAWRHSGVLFADDADYSRLAAERASGATGAWDPFTRHLFVSNATFLYPLTALYFAFGPHVILGQLTVAVAGAGVAAITTVIARQYVRTSAAVAAGVAVAVLPSQILWSSLTLKDAFVWVLLAGVGLAVTQSARTSRGQALFAVAVTALLLFLLAFLRQHTLVVAAWSAAVAGFAPARSGRLLRASALVAVAVVIPWSVGIGPGGLGLVRDRAGTLEQQRALGAENASTALVASGVRTPDGRLVVPRSAAEERALAAAAALAAQGRAAAAAAGEERAAAAASSHAAAAAAARGRAARLDAQSAALANRAANRHAAAAAAARELATRLDAESAALAKRAANTSAAVGVSAPRPGVGDAFGSAGASSEAVRNLEYLPHGLRAMLFEPLPWQRIPNPRVRLAQLETLLWYPLLIFAFLGVAVALLRKPGLLYFAFVGAGTACMWALVEGNFGTAYRHRGEFVWVAALLAAVGVDATLSAIGRCHHAGSGRRVRLRRPAVPGVKVAES